MADVYLTEDALLRDYKKLSQEYKNKAGRYIKNLLKLQRAEKDIQGKLHLFKKSATTGELLDEVYCDFCRKSENEVFRLIATGNDGDAVYICNECARLCGEILDEEEAQENPCPTD